MRKRDRVPDPSAFGLIKQIFHKAHSLLFITKILPFFGHEFHSQNKQCFHLVVMQPIIFFHFHWKNGMIFMDCIECYSNFHILFS